MGEIEEIIEKLTSEEPYEDRAKIKSALLKSLRWEVGHLDQERPHYMEDYKKIFNEVVGR